MTDISLRNIEVVLLQGGKHYLHDFVRSVTMDDLDALAKELSLADGSYIDRLNHAAAELKNPVFMLATIKSSEHQHRLSFHETISVLDVVVRMEEKNVLTREQAEESAVWLISGYPARQGLNLMTEFASIYKPGSILQQSTRVDEALSAHFIKASKRPLEWADFLKLCDFIPKVSIGNVINTMLEHYKARDGIEEIKHIFAASYSGKNFHKKSLAVYEKTLGSDMLISLCQEQMLKASTSLYWPLVTAKDVLGEEALYSGNFKETILESLGKPLPDVPAFMKTLCSQQADLDEWPVTSAFMTENYSRTFGYKGCAKHRGLDEFAIKNGLQAKLIEQKINSLRCELTSLDDWNFEEMKAKTPSEIFNLGSLSKGNQRREESYRELLAACKGVDLIEMKDLLGGVSGDVVIAISDISGGFPNQKDVLRHYPQAKARFLEHDLGM